VKNSGRREKLDFPFIGAERALSFRYTPLRIRWFPRQSKTEGKRLPERCP